MGPGNTESPADAPAPPGSPIRDHRPATAAAVPGKKGVFLSHLLIEKTSWTRRVEGGMWMLTVDVSSPCGATALQRVLPLETSPAAGFCPVGGFPASVPGEFALESLILLPHLMA